MVQSNSGTLILEPWDPEYLDGGENIKTEGYDSLVHSGLEPFSRLYLHNGIWKPVEISST
jgi:hypothetical protein